MEEVKWKKIKVWGKDKKIMSFLLFIGILFLNTSNLSAKPKPLSGQDINGNEWIYARETKTLIFSGTTDLEEYDMDEFSSEPEWWCWQDEAEHLVIEPGITSLQGGEFIRFGKLKTVKLPDTVTYIGDFVFDNCRAMESIELSENIASIGDDAFWGCYSLKSINIPESVTSIGSGVFASCKGLKEIEIPDNVTKIGENAFANCENLSDIKLPKNLKVIKAGLFFNCKELLEIELPFSVEKIQMGAFRYSGIIHIEMPANVTSLYVGKDEYNGYGLFQDCKNLKEITIKSKKLKHIYKGVFRGLNKNTVIKVPKSCLKKYKKLFKKAGLDKKVKVKAEKPMTGQDENGNTWTFDRKTKTLTFSGTTDLEKFEMDGHIPEPEWWCWKDEAEHLVIEPGITGLPEGEFSDFYKLKTIDLPDTVTYIGGDVFDGCWRLETVKMSENITSIGSHAFAWCSSLKSIWIPEKVTYIGRAAFCECESIKEINVPYKVTKIGEVAFANCYNLESVRLPDNLKTVGDSLFYGCRKLSEIRLPDSVKRIEREAFGCSGITHIEIPKNVTGFYKGEDSYGSPGIFQDCKKLKEITIRSEKLDHVFKGAFDRMDKNTVIKVPKSCLKKYKKLFIKAGLDKKIKVKAISGQKEFSGVTSK